MRNIVVVDDPILLPGICLRCRVGKSPNRRYFLDTGLDIDYVGAFYLCNTCLEDIVTNMPDGFLKRDVDAIAEANNDFMEAAIRDRTYVDKVLKELETLGIDTEKLLANLSTWRASIDKIPELEAEMAEEVRKTSAAKEENRVLEREIAARESLEKELAQFKSLQEMNRSLSEEVKTLKEQNQVLKDGLALLAEESKDESTEESKDEEEVSGPIANVGSITPAKLTITPGNKQLAGTSK